MDYTEFYHLKELPFTSSPDDRFYYPSPQQKEATVRLQYAAQSMHGLATVVGDIGTGKTTLGRRFLDTLSPETFEASLLVVTTPVVEPGWFLRRLADRICESPPEEEHGPLIEQICKTLIHLDSQGKKVLFLIDEANMLTSPELLNGIRGLLNVEIEGRKLVTFVLFGLPLLDETLQGDPALRQRVALRYLLRPLSAEDTAEYVKHRVRTAGGSDSLFPDSVYPVLYELSGGLPRLINTICDNALLEGLLGNREAIGPDAVRQAGIALGLTESEPESSGQVERVGRI